MALPTWSSGFALHSIRLNTHTSAMIRLPMSKWKWTVVKPHFLGLMVLLVY